MVAVHALVPAADVWRLLPRLEAPAPRRSCSSPSSGCSDERRVEEIVAGRPRARRRGGARVGAAARRRRARPRGRDRRCPPRRVLALAGAVRRWHALQRPPDVTLEVAPGVGSSGAGCRSPRSGVYVPRGLVSTLVMCAVPAQVAGVERIVVVTPPRAPGRWPRRPSCSGSTAVWALGGPQAIAWLAYVRRVDKIVGPGNAFVNEAKLLVSRDVAIDLPAGPSEVVVLAGRGADRGVAELELAAQAEHGPASTAASSRRTATSRRRSRGSRRSRPSTSSCSARRPRRSRRASATPAPSSSGLVAGRGRRLRHRREPRAADRRLGARGRRARPRDVPEAGDGAAPDGATGSSACGRSSRRSRRSRACRRTRRRCGDEGAPGGVQAVPVGAVDRRARAAAGLDPFQIVRFDGNVPAQPPRRPAGDDRADPRARERPTRTAATRRSWPRSRTTAGVEPENVVLGAGADDLILLCARAFAGPGDDGRDPGRPTYPLYRVAATLAGAEVEWLEPQVRRAHVRCRPNNPTGELRRCPTRGRSSSTRPTSSTAARPRSACSTTASSCCGRSRRRSGSPGRASATRSPPPTRPRS